MLIGQKRSRLKRLFYIILIVVLWHGTARIGLPQMPPAPSPAKTNAGKFLQPESPFQPCWNFPDANFTADKLASDNESVFFSTTDGKLVSVNARTGLKNWDTDYGGSLQTPPKPSDSENAVYIVLKTEIGSSLLVRRLDKKTGVTVWQTTIAVRHIDKEEEEEKKEKGKKKEKKAEEKQTNSDEIFLHSFKDRLLIVTAVGDFYRLDSSDGKIEAVKSFRLPLSSAPFFEGEQFIYFSAEKQIYALAVEDFSRITEYKISETPTSIFKSGGRLIRGDERGEVNSLSVISDSPAIRTNKSNKWKLRTGGAILGIESDGKALIAASLDNFIYGLAINSGKVLWKKRLANRPAFKPTVSENYAALTTVGDASIIFVETKTGRTVNKINLPENIFYTGAPVFVAAMVILLTNRGLSAYTSAKKCGE